MQGVKDHLAALEREGYIRRPAGKRRAIEVVMFTSEEPTRFGVGCLGSRLMSGALQGEAGKHLRDGDGRTLDAVRIMIRSWA